MGLTRRTFGKFGAAPAAALGLLFTLAPGASGADTQYCRHLEAELASEPAARSAATRLERYDQAIEDQTAELSRARRIAQRSGCADLFGNFRGDSSGR
jgi:hypothetical protein